MSQGLDTGNKLYAKEAAVTVQTLQLFTGIPASVGAKVGMIRYLISVFHIKKELVHSHFGQSSDNGPELFRGSYGISGTVQHKTPLLEVRIFFQREIFSAVMKDIIKKTEVENRILETNGAGMVFFFNRSLGGIEALFQNNCKRAILVTVVF